MQKPLKITGIELVINGENGELATVWYHTESVIGHVRWLIYFHEAGEISIRTNIAAAALRVVTLQGKIGTLWTPVETDKLNHVYEP